MSETGYIYTLNDPRTGEPKYVGATKHPQDRLEQHKAGNTNEDVYSWIEDLEKSDLSPELFIVDITSLDELPEKELEIIERVSQEWDLLNRNERATYTGGRGGEYEVVSEKTTECVMKENGRVYIPKSVRKQLGVNGDSADLRLTIEVIEDE